MGLGGHSFLSWKASLRRNALAARDINQFRMSVGPVTVLAGYVVFFLLAMVGFALLLKRRQHPKSPFKKETRLLRGPGESLLKKIHDMDDALPLQLIQAIGLPLFVCSLAAVVTLKWHLASTRTTALVFAGLLMASALAAAWWLVNKALSRANHYLGYYGERVVAELLEPLRAQGWHIFHDVQAQVGKERFNVDHVAIGSGGFFAIETKTRRKGHAIKGREDYKVFYDGKKLLWPWGDEEPYGVDKAIYRAKWLETWLKAATGENIEVKPVLTFPEWYVKETVVDPRLRVVTSSWLPDVLTARRGVLTEKQIDLLARQLDQRCRDVEY